jgi:mRNA interferase MazF
VNRGEIWWYEPPDGKRRPFLIISRDVVIPLLNRVLAVPATTRIRGIPTEVVLDEDDGMPARCALALDNTQPIAKAYCTDLIAQLDARRWRDVCEALRLAVDC